MTIAVETAKKIFLRLTNGSPLIDMPRLRFRKLFARGCENLPLNIGERNDFLWWNFAR